jgi:hypothetical protein
MRLLKTAVLMLAIAAAAAAQSPEPPLSESRLTVHTLVREDIFAGFLANDMERFARGERNVESLLESRPGDRANLLAWRGSAALYRAVLAHEGGRGDEFQRQFQRVRENFAEASTLQSRNDGVSAIIGGSLSTFADRLPQPSRSAAWAQAYDAYAILWKFQSAVVDKLPVHFRGELLAGLAQAAQRSGRTEEAAQYLDRLLTSLAGTPYEAMAKRWKADPAAAATTKITCKNCHEPGRLSAQLTTLERRDEP